MQEDPAVLVPAPSQVGVHEAVLDVRGQPLDRPTRPVPEPVPSNQNRPRTEVLRGPAHLVELVGRNPEHVITLLECGFDLELVLARGRVVDDEGGAARRQGAVCGHKQDSRGGEMLTVGEDTIIRQNKRAITLRFDSGGLRLAAQSALVL